MNVSQTVQGPVRLLRLLELLFLQRGKAVFNDLVYSAAEAQSDQFARSIWKASEAANICGDPSAESEEYQFVIDISFGLQEQLFAGATCPTCSRSVPRF